MFNSVTVYDLQYNHSNNYRVVATNSLNQTVSLTGPKAKKFLVENYFKGYFANAGSDSGILPPGVRIIGSNYVVFERPPCYQNIFYNPDRVHSGMDSTPISVYRIPIPWQIYVVTYTSDYYVSDVRMYFSPTSLMSRDQHVYLPPIPNFYTSGLLCRPYIANMEDLDRYSKDLSGVIACAYDWIWNNGTNNDLNETMVHVNLQLVARSGKKNTLFENMQDDVYESYFKNPYNCHYYQHQQVTSMLSVWENLTIEQAVALNWPVPSRDKHFEARYYYSSNDADSIIDNDHYYDWLDSWVRDNYEECSDEEIDSIIENGDYDGSAYFEYVVSNHIPLNQVEFKPMTLENILQIVLSDSIVPNIKSLVSSFVTNAILIDGSFNESSSVLNV